MTRLSGLEVSGGMALTSEDARASAQPDVSTRLGQGLLAIAVLATVALTCQLRWSLVSTLPWQCDEIPLLVRFTGLCGHAVNEAEAVEFSPSLYSFRMGALRSLRVPDYTFAVHTSAGFWTNLSLHLFGYGPGAGRAVQFFWSVIAIVAVAWAAWLVVRSPIAALGAAWLMALSPAAVAYGAQARGYVEAMALAPLLLIALEYLRRKPDSLPRAALTLLCAVQLSLTVYTTWVYWVLPVIALALLHLPGLTVDRQLRRFTRSVLGVLALGLGLLMVVYTAARWKQLSHTASAFGADLGQPGEVASFLDRLAGHFLPAPLWLSLLAVIGIAVLWRSTARWWIWAIGLGIAVPVLFALLHGSPGYVRNLIYLLGPLAILFGLGVDRVLRVAAVRLRPLPVTLIAALVTVGASAWAYAGLGQRARDILLPDWGDVTLALNVEPETVGPRWFCPCLANHWQINWYRTPQSAEVFLSIPPGGTIEVVMGAQLRESDEKAVVYRVDPARSHVREEPLPTYLAAVKPAETRSGVEVRRWLGTKQPLSALASLHSDVPVFIIARMKVPPPDATRLTFFNQGGAYAAGVVPFKRVPSPDGSIQSMLVPAGALEEVVTSLRADLAIDEADIHVFGLTPLLQEFSSSPKGKPRSVRAPNRGS